MQLSRAKLEEMIHPILEKLKEPTIKALNDAKMDKVDKIIFVGGSTRIPIVQKIVKDLTGKEGDKSVNPDEAVALGAISAGLKFCAFYPMSPSTSIAQTMIEWAKEMDLVVLQAEDEIAAINLAKWALHTPESQVWFLPLGEDSL